MGLAIENKNIFPLLPKEIITTSTGIPYQNSTNSADITESDNSISKLDEIIPLAIAYYIKAKALLSTESESQGFTMPINSHYNSKKYIDYSFMILDDLLEFGKSIFINSRSLDASEAKDLNNFLISHLEKENRNGN